MSVVDGIHRSSAPDRLRFIVLVRPTAAMLELGADDRIARRAGTHATNYREILRHRYDSMSRAGARPGLSRTALGESV